MRSPVSCYQTVNSLATYFSTKRRREVRACCAGCEEDSRNHTLVIALNRRISDTYGQRAVRLARARFCASDGHLPFCRSIVATPVGPDAYTENSGAQNGENICDRLP